MSEEQMRITLAKWAGYARLAEGSPVLDPLLGMDLVCGFCSAVVVNHGGYNWVKHDDCGPMGGECYGGKWKLFKSCWSFNGAIVRLPQLTLDWLHELEKKLTKGQLDAYCIELIDVYGDEAVIATKEQRAKALLTIIREAPCP